MKLFTQNAVILAVETSQKFSRNTHVVNTNNYFKEGGRGGGRKTLEKHPLPSLERRVKILPTNSLAERVERGNFFE